MSRQERLMGEMRLKFLFLSGTEIYVRPLLLKAEMGHGGTGAFHTASLRSVIIFFCLHQAT